MSLSAPILSALAAIEAAETSAAVNAAYDALETLLTDDMPREVRAELMLRLMDIEAARETELALEASRRAGDAP